MTGDAVLDRKSLTLPDWRAALKRRVRRPRRPDGRLVVLLANYAVCLIIEVALGVLARWLPAYVLAAGSGVWAYRTLRVIWREQSWYPNDDFDRGLSALGWLLWSAGMLLNLGFFAAGVLGGS